MKEELFPQLTSEMKHLESVIMDLITISFYILIPKNENYQQKKKNQVKKEI